MKIIGISVVFLKVKTLKGVDYTGLQKYIFGLRQEWGQAFFVIWVCWIQIYK